MCGKETGRVRVLWILVSPAIRMTPAETLTANGDHRRETCDVSETVDDCNQNLGIYAILGSAIHRTRYADRRTGVVTWCPRDVRAVRADVVLPVRDAIHFEGSDRVRRHAGVRSAVVQLDRSESDSLALRDERRRMGDICKPPVEGVLRLGLSGAEREDEGEEEEKGLK
jgi:hypothetical protein